MKKGSIVVISGPSGVGKGTIVKELLKVVSDFSLSVSCTTRKPRTGEENGREYFFISKEEFLSGINNGEFVEYAQFANNFYGTRISNIENSINIGKNIILEIEVQGAMQIKEKFPDSKLIFIMPPNIEELKNRLVSRNTESKDAINLRLAQVDREIKNAERFDKKIVNDDLSKAVKEDCEYLKNI